jgi:hypothetical protein
MLHSCAGMFSRVEGSIQVLIGLASSNQTAVSLLRTPDASPIRCILKLVLLRSRIAYKFSHLVSETFLILFLHQFGGKMKNLFFRPATKNFVLSAAKGSPIRANCKSTCPFTTRMKPTPSYWTTRPAESVKIPRSCVIRSVRLKIFTISILFKWFRDKPTQTEKVGAFLCYFVSISFN